MFKLKSLLNALIIIFAIIAVEIFREKTSIPVTILDLTLTPLILIFMWITFAGIFSNKPHLVDNQEKTMNPIIILLIALASLTLGAWCFYQGVVQPLVLFSGVKGSLHGYSLAVIGLAIIIFSLFMFYSTFKIIK